MKACSLTLLKKKKKKVIPDSHLDADVLVFKAKNRTTPFDVAAVIFSSRSPPPSPTTTTTTHTPTSTPSTPVSWRLLPIRRAEDWARCDCHSRHPNTETGAAAHANPERSNQQVCRSFSFPLCTYAPTCARLRSHVIPPDS